MRHVVLLLALAALPAAAQEGALPGADDGALPGTDAGGLSGGVSGALQGVPPPADEASSAEVTGGIPSRPLEPGTLEPGWNVPAMPADPQVPAGPQGPVGPGG